LPIIEYETISDKDIKKYLHSVYNGPAGHFLVNETLTKLRSLPAIREVLEKEPTLSKGLRARCERFVRECPTCQKHTFQKVVNRAQPFTVSQYSPMDTLMIDYIEKLPEDSEGCKFILVIVDCFSRFCTLHATKTTQASELAMKLLIHASFFGMPCRLTSDRGSSLTSNLIEDFTALVGTEHIKALAASKEEMAIVERLNREVMRHLRNIVFDRQHYDNWSRMLPFTNRILNSTVHSSTGMSPAEITFESSIRLNRGILAPLLEGEIDTVWKNCTYKEYITNMWSTQQSLIARARANLQEKDTKQILKKNEKNDNEVTKFPIDSYVLTENSSYWLVRREPNKLKPILKGPFKVVAVSDDNARYTVLNLISMRLRTYHVSALRSFLARPEDTDFKYAVRDDNFL
jgi:transposase InsO family protein